MPHVSVKMFPGRSEEQKKALTEAIAKALIEHASSSEPSISIAIDDVAKDDWNTQVYDTQIAPAMERLYRKPGYKRS